MKQHRVTLTHKLAAIAAFTIVSAALWPHVLGNQAPPPPSGRQTATCDLQCHAQGLAAITARIDTQVSRLEHGHQCWPTDHQPTGLVPRTVIVKGAYARTDEAWRMTFTTAWAASTDRSKGNDVWVLAVCK